MPDNQHHKFITQQKFSRLVHPVEYIVMAGNSFGPPPSDSDSDDFDGMSFGIEFEEV